MAKFWAEFKRDLWDALNPTIRVPNPMYYWRRWRRGKV